MKQQHSKYSKASRFGSSGKRTVQQRVEAKLSYESMLRELPNSILIFTDGASKQNPGLAGCGVCVMLSTHLYKNENDIKGLFKIDRWEGHQSLGIATNNVAELNALHVALHMVSNQLKDRVDWEKVHTIEIFSDSRYVVNAVNRVNKAVANRELIENLIGKMSECNRDICRINLQWIPAHCGLEGNERADFLCDEAIKESDIRCDMVIQHAVDHSEFK